MNNITCVVAGRAPLGESPVWDAAGNAIWWIDGESGLIFRHDIATAATHQWSAGQKVGSIALRARGGLVCALESGFGFFDPQTGQFDPIEIGAITAARLPFNDGKCDAFGRFWAATMDEDGRAGALWRLDPDLTAHCVATGFGVPNGPNWGLDGTTFLMAESMDQVIWAWDFDPEGGTIANRRVFAKSTDEAVPDGSALDADGNLWSAKWDGWRIDSHAPDGSVTGSMALPVLRPTSVAFGGSDLKTLYITTATWDLDPEAMAAQPLAGSLLSAPMATAGMPVPSFAG